MAIESIKTPKAPTGWSPSGDQRARIASDSRLKQLSKDELYLFFQNNPGSSRRVQRTPESGSSGASTRKSSTGGGGGFFDRIASQIGEAIRGGR